MVKHPAENVIIQMIVGTIMIVRILIVAMIVLTIINLIKRGNKTCKLGR